MGPRLFSRGNKVSDLQKLAEKTKLQWGHDFSAVEMTLENYLLITILLSFNGATTFQPWKSYDFLGTEATVKSASMGPRLFSRGNDVDCHPRLPLEALQWGHDFSAVEICGRIPLEERL